ncbi:leucine-rich repeat extensin-like protein 1 isoform X3 [Fagus crenata]
MIGKIGPYTVFMTPPSTPKPTVEQPVFDSPKKIVVPPPPPVQPPPQQFDKSIQSSNDSVTGFFKNAVTKVQNGGGVESLLIAIETRIKKSEEKD